MPEYYIPDTICPLCWLPLGDERHFHMECARRENFDAEAEDEEVAV